MLRQEHSRGTGDPVSRELALAYVLSLKVVIDSHEAKPYQGARGPDGLFDLFR